MMKLCLLAAVAIVLVALGDAAPRQEVDNGNNGTIWAVLVAGSNTYDNYRHQADVCHAYQIFRRHGVPDSNIIVMMYDDIANDSENPKKGKIINKPDGPDVYKNVPKDYTKDAVNSKNFLNILTGNKAGLNGQGSGKVLKSGPNDHVFINFVDHGATGLVAFPNDYLYADDLNKALKTMHKKNMYKRLVFYMEACEGGSMFQNILPKNIEVYAATASNAIQSSYACYCDDAEMNDVCLGDEFSVAWMEDIDSEEQAGTFTSETLIKQYNTVVKKVKRSHPQLYGQKSQMKTEDISDFFGNQKTSWTDGSQLFNNEIQGEVPSREVVMHRLNRKIERANGDAKMKLQAERDTLVKGRKTVDQLFDRIMKTVATEKGYKVKDLESSHSSLNLDIMPCYRTLVDNFHTSCVNINQNTYALAHLYKLANLCALEDFSAQEMLEIYSAECTDGHRALTNVN